MLTLRSEITGIDTEYEILGAMMRTRKDCRFAMERMTAKDLSTPMKQWMFDLIVETWAKLDADGVEIDPYDCIADSMMDAITTMPGLHADEIFIVSELIDYAMVRSVWMKESMRRLFQYRQEQEILRASSNPDPLEMVAIAHKWADRAGSLDDEGVKFKKMTVITPREHRPLNLVPKIGVPTLDETIQGFQPGRIVVIGARPGGGKSAMGCQCAFRNAFDGFRVAYVSTEMSEGEIVERTEDLRKALGIRNEGYKESVSVAASGHNNVDDIIQSLKDSGPYDLIVVDYLQWLTSGDDGKQLRTYAIEAQLKKIKIMAQETQIPFLVLAQMGRGEGLDMARLKDSASIEQTADQVILLDSIDHSSFQAECQLVKNRHGGTWGKPLQFVRVGAYFKEALDT